MLLFDNYYKFSDTALKLEIQGGRMEKKRYWWQVSPIPLADIKFPHVAVEVKPIDAVLAAENECRDAKREDGHFLSRGAPVSGC